MWKSERISSWRGAFMLIALYRPKPKYMAIIISKNGKGAIKVDKSNFELEDRLQQYIYDNPETIPLYDIKEDIRLLILAREFSTKSGPIDALGVDKDGEIYLIETKLYKNPDKRTVVAQVLDYGASLWSNYRDFNSFTDQISIHTDKDFKQNISQRLNDFFGVTDEEAKTLLDNVRRNLNDGNFKFVVLMDHLHDQLRDLIVFLNNNSEFTVYAVELEYYKHKDYEILIPKLYGAEVKKDLGSKPSQSIPTDDEFINSISDSNERNNLKQLLTLFNDLREGRKEIEGVNVAKTPKNINFYINTSYEGKITASHYIVSGSQGPRLDFWGPQRLDKEVKKIVKENIPKIELTDKMKTTFGMIAKWKLGDYDNVVFEKLLRQLAKI
ncbi:hypothetical protein JXA63_03740 [Candidatus Woesebacteria bacterium]|nr:hypothetical protein [Candidatus Woesebacteria bacterium]